MDKSKVTFVLTAVLPFLLPLLIGLLYFTGVVWESYYYQEFELNSGGLGSGFSDLLVTGFVAWFQTGAESWVWFVALSLALVFISVVIAITYEQKWLEYKSKKRLELAIPHGR